MEGKLKLIKV